ncbi:MAG: hypothetical protein ABL993_08675 [Vicinamibacterales bacterium]
MTFWRDRLASVLFFLAAAAGSFVLSGLIPPSVYDIGGDVWFEADIERIYRVMTGFGGNRSNYHPLFAICVMPPTTALIRLGLEPLVSIRIILALLCGLWSSLFFWLLRVIGCRLLDATIFSFLALVSASAIFWSAVPETFLPGSITIVLAFIWAAADERGVKSRLTEALVSAGTFAMSVTNWMVGLVSAFFRRPVHDAIQISANALVITVIAWVAQKYVMPESEFFLGLTYGEEGGHIFSPEALGLGAVVSSFVAHTMVMPEIQLVSRPSSGQWLILLTQGSSPSSAGAIGLVALLLWAGLLALGAWALLTLKIKSRLRLLLATTLLGQLLLHLVFGNETFFYSFHWMPLLVMTAAFGTFTRLRMVSMTLAILMAACAAVNNLGQFRESVRFLEQYEPVVLERIRAERREVKGGDPWPLSAIPLETFGFESFDQWAYEPGGGLWPAGRTFNVGFWVVDETGRLVATSHDRDPSETGALKTDLPDGTVQVEVRTSYFRASWVTSEPRVWRLRLNVSNIENRRVYLALRGVGWATSRIYSLAREDGRLRINTRWVLATALPQEKVRIGTEETPSWTTPPPGTTATESLGGWGFARIGPIEPGEHEMTLIDEGRGGSADTFIGKLSYVSSH